MDDPQTYVQVHEAPMDDDGGRRRRRAFEALDAKPAGTYQRLVDTGVVTVDAERVVEVRTLIDRVLAFLPVAIVCDRFRLGKVTDAVAGRCSVLPRVTHWRESTEDIQAARRLGWTAILRSCPPCARCTG